MTRPARIARAVAHAGRLAAIACAGAGVAGWTTGPMSILDPAGPGAEPITRVWWAMFWGGLLILIGVTALALYATYRRPDRRVAVRPGTLIFGGGVVFSLVVLLALLVYGIRSGEALLPSPADEDVFRVEVVAHQWWWQIAYPDARDGPLFSANEIHIPVGRPVHVHVTGADVIHSFWVPRLGGKVDAIPGQTNVIRLQASTPGIYRGQCAEFCGGQHARMALHVEAHAQDEALAARLQALAMVRAAQARQAEPEGAAAFLKHCMACHSVDATFQGIGPNLADLSLRRHIGAGTMPNTPDSQRRWIVEQHLIKPGNPMPRMDHLDARTVEAIARYLEEAGR